MKATITNSSFYSILCIQFFLWIDAFEQETISGENFTPTCPIGCQCSLNGVPKMFETPAGREPKVSEKAAVCDGVTFEDLRTLNKDLPADLHSLTLKNNGLTNLMELCCFETLNFLDVSFNNLSSVVTYASFMNLTYLNLQNNNLRILRQAAFTSFPSLQILNLDNNQIHRINLETFRLFRLKELHLSRNQISYISERIFRYTPNLEILNLKGNNLISVHNRNFYFSPSLLSVDLSYNRIVTVDSEAFENLKNLEEVSLAYNNLLQVPSRALKQLERLKMLNLNGNPIRLFASHSFSNLSIQKIHLSHSGSLQMVLKDSFYNLSLLSHVFLSGNEHLVYVSPSAFTNTPKLEFLDFQDSSLRLVPKSIFSLSSIKEVNLAGNPLDCGCMNLILENKDRKRVLKNSDKTWCYTVNGKTYPILSKSGANTCDTKVILAEKTDKITLQVGAKFKLYCVLSTAKDEKLLWTLPSGRNLQSRVFGRLSSFDEYLDFEFILHSDDGRYICSASDTGKSVQNSIDLEVAKPDIELYPIEIASYYVTLGWNRTLKSNSKNGQFLIDYQELGKAYNTVFTAVLPHSMFWRSYTLTHLKAETNYSFCLIYQYSNLTLYKRCAELRTSGAIIGMARTLNYGILVLIAVMGSFMCAVCFARCVHKRFHIWQEEKYRSRMAESISGQSFLSSAESLNCGDIAVTYENVHMSSSLCSSISDGNDSERSRIGYVRKHKVRRETDISRDLAL